MPSGAKTLDDVWEKAIEGSSSLDAKRRFQIYSYAYEDMFGSPFLKGYGTPEDDEACIAIISRCIESRKPYDPYFGIPDDAVF